MLAVLAGIGVVLAAIGVFGFRSHFVNQRAREIRIPFALGVQLGDVLVLVVKLGLTLAGAGLAIGVALTLGLNRFMTEHLWLFHFKATDPATYAAVGVVLVSIALLACYVPARITYLNRSSAKSFMEALHVLDATGPSQENSLY